jgi:hypothetical protein
MLRLDGALNRAFFCTLFKDHAMAIEFLNDIGFIRRTMQCNCCKRFMTWSGRFMRLRQLPLARAPHQCISAIRHGPVALTFLTNRTFLSDHLQVWVLSNFFLKNVPRKIWVLGNAFLEKRTPKVLGFTLFF